MINVSNNFVEPTIDNKVASRYIEEHYDEILHNIAKMGVCQEKQHDLLNDVYVSIVTAEENGEGFDMYKSDTPTLVTNFVYGRIKGYSNNPKYRTDVVEYKNKGKHGNAMIVKASSNSGNISELDEFQSAYLNAVDRTYSISEVEEKLSIKGKIEFCTEFNHVIGIDIMSLFKNIELLGKADICKSMFNKLRSAFKLHDEFADAFIDVIEFAKKDAVEFQQILAAM